MSESSTHREDAVIDAVGGSMSPFIPGGSRLRVRRVPTDGIRDGDVICYLGRGGGTVAHRVVGRGRSQGRPVFRARGDAARAEELVPEDAVLYVVTRVESGLLSYDTGSAIGRAIARVALGGQRTALLSSAIGAAMRTLAISSTQVRRAESFLGPLALAALDAPALRRLTVRAYEGRGDDRGRGLFDWEREWFDADLPRAKARILVGGAGAGRELRHLAERGHEIVAFDPVPGFVGRARGQAGAACLAALEGAYEDLVDRTPGTAAAFADGIDGFAPYGAVLLGWGSLSHVTAARYRRDLLVELKGLCPSGPVLASFWMRDARAPEPEGRAARLGRRMGALLSGRGRASDDPEPGDMVLSHCGFGHGFTRHELEGLAAAAGYEVARFEDGGTDYPHATLVPSSRA